MDQLMDNAGVIDASSLGDLVDIGGMLACQPLPEGKRVTVIGDAHELVMLAGDTCVTAGFRIAEQISTNSEEHEDTLAEGLDRASQLEDTDMILVIHLPAGRFRSVNGPHGGSPARRGGE